MQERVTFVVNPAACSGRGAEQWYRLEPIVREAFPLGDIRFTTGRGSARQITEAVMADLGEESALMVAVGGDGTVHEVASGLLGLAPALRSRARLGVLQNGTGNDFVRGAGIPQRVREAIGLLATDAAAEIDVGLLRCQALETDEEVERWFVNAADFGIGAEVVRRMESGRRWFGGKPSYLWQTLRTLIGWRNPSIELQLDGGAVETHKVKTVAICNQPWFGGGMCVAPDAVHDDGILQCTVFGDLGRIEAMKRLGETYQGTYVQHPKIAYRSCSTLEACSDRELLIETDGELAGRLPARFEVRPRALRVVLPPRCDGQAAQTKSRSST